MRANPRTTAREYLVAAIRELLDRRGIDSVSVRDVCELSGVSRATFYRYFRGIWDLAYQVFMDDLVSTVFKGYKDDRGWHQTFAATLHIIDANRGFYIHALQDDGFVAFWREQAFLSDLDDIRQKLEGREVDEALVRRAARLSAAISAQSAVDWARREVEDPAETFADSVVEFCHHGICGVMGIDPKEISF